MRWLASDAIVLRMGADPEPQDAIRCVDCQRTIVSADARRVEPANSFEMQRGVLWIGLKELELFVGKGPDLLWQLVIRAPETRGRIVDQSFCERPAR